MLNVVAPNKKAQYNATVYIALSNTVTEACGSSFNIGFLFSHNTLLCSALCK
jgi:hypothetical protein